MRYLILSWCFLFMMAAYAVESRLAYVGTVADLPVQLNLRINGQQLSGEYYYEKIGKSIHPEGALGKNRAVTLYEFAGDLLRTNRSGERTNHRFSGTLSADNRALSGVWISADGRRKYPFALKAVATYTIIERKWVDGEFFGCYPTFLNVSPELKKMEYQYREELIKALNTLRETLKEIPPGMKEMVPFTDYIEYKLTYFSTDLIGIQRKWYSYYGGAHGLTNNHTYNYRLQDGQLRRIRLRSLFKPQANYRSAFMEYILADLKRQKASWPEKLKPEDLEPEDHDTFLIGPAGLTFIFDVYTVSPYAEGTYYSLVPYRLLHDLLNPHGPLGRFVQASAE